MTDFKIGDRVRLIRVNPAYVSCVGYTGVVRYCDIYNQHIHVREDQSQSDRTWHAEYTELIEEKKTKEKNMSTKYYRVVKDHPAFETDAILSNEKNSERYSPVTDIFYKEIKGCELPDSGYYEVDILVEYQAEWFERVYPIGKLEKMAFGNKKQAQAAAAALYKEEK